MDEFSDDDFDALNANALQELENNAIQFTQAQRKYELSQHESNYGLEDDDLDDTVVQDELRGKSALPPEKTIQLPPPPSSRVVPVTDTGTVATWGQAPVSASRFRPQPIASTSGQPVVPLASSRPSQQFPSRGSLPYRQFRPPPPLPRPAPPIPSRYQPSQVPRQNAPPSHEISSLQAQILDLKARLTTKDGEIGIVRKRLEKTREDHERELQTLKKQTAEQLAKHEREVEAAKAAQQNAATELEFTRRDLKEELTRAKRRDGPATPKKNAGPKSWGVADGFEDVEMAGSPSRRQRGKNAGAVASAMAEPLARGPRTPTKGKRKRPVADSPVMALEVHSEDVFMADNTAAKVQASTGGQQQQQQFSTVPKGSSFDYLKVILNHSAAHGRPLAFEYLANFALPSRPTESLASILFQKLAVAGDPNDPMSLPIEFCEQVIQLWDSCRKESCLAPITELISLLSFTLQLRTVAVAPYIAQSLIPVAMDSCYEVSIPRFNNPNLEDPTDESYKNFNTHISSTEILSLMYLTATGCATSPPVGAGLTSPAVDFWSLVHVEFVLMLLCQKQPVEDFLAVLRLLCTSVFPDSIGPISPSKSAEMVAYIVIERLSWHLTDLPRWDVDQLQLRVMRNAVLQTLAAFARSPFGLAQLAISDYAVPRLVTLLSSCIDELYDGDMQYRPREEHDDMTALLHTLVATTLQLLHMIITNPMTADLTDVSGKLAKNVGGSQKYLLSLARLNFSEDLVSEEMAELAHELLELAATSEEGEDMGLFFGG
ncbi:hypothetical protein F4779DRAFT_591054 [Xylariaceae sp. FL0662B]|nr:hypothetical protein F4779DRAFT_591054 [Xylariaceae sp. FL0662B]